MEPNNNMNNVPNQQPPAMSQMPQMPQKPASSAGTIVAVLVILAVLVIGGFYFWGERAGDESMNTAPQQTGSDLEADIEADLNATDVENVDYDLNPDNFNAS